ncbi:MAG TPA: hypothetical protein VFG86_27450 [Chloroflexota bacterium]|jgi:hypothetical protein|nr:hypothetical protein [Chloroflexota bacterium]
MQTSVTEERNWFAGHRAIYHGGIQGGIGLWAIIMTLFLRLDVGGLKARAIALRYLPRRRPHHLTEVRHKTY